MDSSVENVCVRVQLLFSEIFPTEKATARDSRKTAPAHTPITTATYTGYKHAIFVCVYVCNRQTILHVNCETKIKTAE